MSDFNGGKEGFTDTQTDNHRFRLAGDRRLLRHVCSAHVIYVPCVSVRVCMCVEMCAGEAGFNWTFNVPCWQ